MALNSGPNISLGYGIGLSAIPDTKGQDWAHQAIVAQQQQARAQEAARRGAMDKAKDDSEKDIYNISQKIKATQVHPMFKNQQLSGGKEVIQKMHEVHAAKPYENITNDQGFNEVFYKFDTNSQIAKDQSAAYAQFDNDVNDALKNPDLYDVDQNILNEYNKSMNLGGPTDKWKEITGNDYGYINPMDIKRKVIKAKPQEWQSEWQKRFPKGLPSEKGGEWVEGNFIKGSNVVSFDEKAAGDAADLELQSPNSIVARRVMAESGGDYNIAKYKLVEDLRNRTLKESKSTIKSYDGAYGMNKKEIDSALKTEVTIRPDMAYQEMSSIFPQYQKVYNDMYGDLEGVKVIGYFPTNKTLTLNEIIPDGAVYINSGKKYKGKNISNYISYGAVGSFPFNKNTGELVKDESERQKLIDSGDLVYKSAIPAIVSEKNPALFKEGEVTKTQELVIPYEPFKTQLKSSGIPIDEIEKSVIDLNEGLKSKVKTGSVKSNMETQTKELNDRTNNKSGKKDAKHYGL